MLAPGRPLKCDSCGAKVPWVEGAASVECAYCHAQVVLRPLAAPQVGHPRAPRNNAVLLVVVGGGLVLGGVMVATFLLAPSRPAEVSGPVAVVAPPVTPPPPPAPVEVAKPWKAVRSFGELGTGPGMFTGPRRLAVTDDGQVFVAEASTGRLHHFDASGAFVRLIELSPDRLTKKRDVFGLAADHAGHLWVNRVGDLLQYRVADGALVKTIAGDYPDTWFHGAVSIDGRNHVYAATDRMGDRDLVVFDAAGKRLHRHKGLGAQALAVDGLGTVFALRDKQVDVLAPDFTVKARFDVSSHGQVMKVDDRGRFYLDEPAAIGAYEPGGKHLASFDVPSFNDFAVARDGTLVVLHTDGRVTTYEVTWPSP